MTSPNAFASESVEAVDKETQHADSMAYLAALNTVNLILIDAANLQRNNHMVYTSALCLAMQKIADGDEQGQILLQTIQQCITFDQEYLMKSGKGCVEILAEFKKLSHLYC